MVKDGWMKDDMSYKGVITEMMADGGEWKRKTCADLT